MLHMATSGFMPWPALTRVRALIAEAEASSQTGGVIFDNRPMPTIVDKAEAVGVMLDEWVSAAAVSPRVVMHEHAQGDDALWIEDVPFAVRKAIFDETWPTAPTTAGVDFRNESDSAPPGQDREAVRDAALVAVRDDGSDGGAGS